MYPLARAIMVPLDGCSFIKAHLILRWAFLFLKSQKVGYT